MYKTAKIIPVFKKGKTDLIVYLFLITSEQHKQNTTRHKTQLLL